jgi:hypothetical protein
LILLLEPETIFIGIFKKDFGDFLLVIPWIIIGG